MRLVANDAEATARFRNEALALMDNNMNGAVALERAAIILK